MAKYVVASTAWCVRLLDLYVNSFVLGCNVLVIVSYRCHNVVNVITASTELYVLLTQKMSYEDDTELPKHLDAIISAFRDAAAIGMQAAATAQGRIEMFTDEQASA